MIKRHINLKTTRLKQARKQAYAKRQSFSLQKKINQPNQNIRKNHSVLHNSYFLKNRPFMNQFKGQIVEDWVAIRILDFLNRARTTEALTNVQEPLNNENEYSIGVTVAQRILDYRQRLAPFRRFTTLAQLENIEGFGLDKFNDLVRLLAHRADDTFKNAMYNGVIFENWDLKFHRFEFKTIQAVATSASQLREIITNQIEELSLKRNNDRTIARLGKKIVANSYIESFPNQEYAAVALAFWLYKVDADNWFSLERVLEKTRNYFAHYDRLEHRLELKLLKGFPNRDILVNALTTDDLPIIINHAEKTISIWTVGLSD